MSDSDSVTHINRPRARREMFAVTLAGVLLISAALAAAGLRSQSADAMAGCLAHQNTAEEMDFIAQLQAWRDGHISGSNHLTVSAPLNAAAAGYAQFLATHPGYNGHYADGTSGYPWASRAVACGYPSGDAGGGEGLAVVEASVQVSVSPAQALTTMTSENGGGVWVPANIGAPVKCVGVAKMASSDGHKVAWVTLVFATFSSSCPQAVTGGTQPSTTSTSTSTATNTPTATPTSTPTPTPSPTPGPRYGATISIASGWNLVTLPTGPVTDVMARARGCFSSVYQPNGDRWLRYSPLVPDWANNMVATNGGAVWINGTGAAGCGNIQL